MTQDEKQRFGVFENSRGYEYFTAYTFSKLDRKLKVSENSDGHVELSMGDESVVFNTIELLGLTSRLMSWIQRQTFITEEEEQEVEESNAFV
jgi:hypothetical protein